MSSSHFTSARRGDWKVRVRVPVFLLLVVCAVSHAQTVRHGGGQQPLAATVRVTPDTIDFGRVRVNIQRDSFFTIENNSTVDITLRNTNYKDQLSATHFSVSNNPVEGQRIPALSLLRVNVSYISFREGPEQGVITVASSDPTRPVPTVTLRAIGVYPHVSSRGQGFGPLRVGDVSPMMPISIYNYGSDSTRIDSVVIQKGSDSADFSVKISAFPPRAPAPLHLGFERGDSLSTIQTQFAPRSLGAKRLVLAIYTPDTVLFDTLSGKGVEPLVSVGPDVVDFGTITVKKIGDPNPTPTQLDLPFAVANKGEYVARLFRLVYSDSTHFRVRLNKPTVDLNEFLQPLDSIRGMISFFVLEEGDFQDTIRVTNDSRYSLYSPPEQDSTPKLIVRAKVRTGPIDTSFVAFKDTIKTCDTMREVLVIHNPYPVEVHIDSIRFGDTPDDTLGFQLGAFGFPINIAPDSTFGIPLDYAFPDQLFNGPQTLTLILFQRRGGGQTPIGRRVTASLVRERRTLTLNSVLPTWISSASDIDPMRMPITLHGPRAGVGELDSFVLSLRFSNDLFMPIGIDDQRSLLKPLRPGGYVHTDWDQTARTYTIRAVGVPVSDPSRLADSVLLTVIMRAFLTTDTDVTVTPTFTFLKHPCAYNLQPFTLSIPYANECGEPLIRNFMATGESPGLDVTGLSSNPVKQGESVTIGISLPQEGDVELSVSDVAGRILSSRWVHREPGRSSVVLMPDELPHSGSAFVTLSVRSSDGLKLAASKTVKIAVSE